MTPLDFSPATALFPHQLEAVEFIADKHAVAIFDEQGLGKTKIVLESILRGMHSGNLDGALIVCRAGLVPTWRDEVSKHTHLTAVEISGSAGTAGSGFATYSPFYLTAYSLLHRELARLRQLLQVRKLALVLDEAHTIKNPQARATLDAFSLSELARKRIIVTGTPVANYPEDLWAQFYFLDHGKTLGTDFEAFRLFYDLGTGARRRDVSLSSLQTLKERIRPLSIRRTKEETLELPEKSYATVVVIMKGSQAEMYRVVRDELRLELLDHGKLAQTVSVENAFVRLLRLVQVSSNPALIDPGYDGVPAKFAALDSMIQQIVANGEKAIVWSQFVENVRLLRRKYSNFGSAEIHGGIPIEARHDVVRRFQSDPKKSLIFAVPAAAREGVTLTAANNAIYLDRGFNMVDYIQSQDRIHRIGQERRCVVTKIVARDSVDEFVEAVLARKADIAGEIQSGIEHLRSTAGDDVIELEHFLAE
ncbi:MAG: DEAD/DEAH box helicase [Thermoplasmata archaeon]